MGEETLPAPDDEALAARAKTGDPEALRELFRRHQPRLRRFVGRLTGPTIDADDVVQNVMLEALRSLPTFRGDSSIWTWLGSIAVRVSRRALRRVTPMALRLEATRATAGDDPPGPEESADTLEGVERLDRILSELSAKPREAFVLHVIEGHPLADVAEMLGASLPAVKMRVHEARRALSGKLRKDTWFGAAFTDPEEPDDSGSSG